MKLKSLLALTSAAILSIGITGCSGKNPEANPASSAAGAAGASAKTISVYASTNVWAAVAKEIAGDKVNVTSSLTDPGQDPHDYQASAKDKKLINDATVVIINGGGYDAWAEQMAASAPAKPLVLDAVKISGKAPAGTETDHDHADHDDHDHDHDGDHDHDDHDHDHDGDHDHDDHHHHHHHHGSFNEHVFYDLDTAEDVAEKLAEHLAGADKTNADTYQKNYQNFKTKLDQLEERADKIGEGKDLHALATEPVAGYLLETMDIHDLTPAEFINQSETEAGPSVLVQQQTLDLIKNKQVQVLVLNVQTEDPISDKLSQQAQSQQIPVIKVSETLPAGISGYLQWMENNIAQFEKALS